MLTVVSFNTKFFRISSASVQFLLCVTILNFCPIHSGTVCTVDSKSLSTPIYFDSPHRLNTLAQSLDMTSKLYLGDHLKARLHNR